ncbi:hypothetical protein J4453_00345 [Candidatus Woesearchaeota archaeon]|nr:hypothetical protein [Candidatus Woesearchaeota archaeon]
MNVFEWCNAKIKKLDWLDIGLIKLSVAAFVLWVAKYWVPLLSLEGYWYVVIFVLAVIRPLARAFRKS